MFAVPSNDTPPIVLPVLMQLLPVISVMHQQQIYCTVCVLVSCSNSCFSVTTKHCTHNILHSSSLKYLFVEPSVRLSVVNPVRFLVVKKTPKPVCVWRTLIIKHIRCVFICNYLVYAPDGPVFHLLLLHL